MKSLSFISVLFTLLFTGLLTIQAQNYCDSFKDYLSAVENEFKGKYDPDSKEADGKMDLYTGNETIFGMDYSLAIHDRETGDWTMKFAFYDTDSDEKFHTVKNEIYKCKYKYDLDLSTQSDVEMAFEYPVAVMTYENAIIILSDQPAEGKHHIYLLIMKSDL